MNIFPFLSLYCLYFIKDAQAQIQIVITVTKSSGNNNSSIQSLNCKITNLTDTHFKCQHIWWVQEINGNTHTEAVIDISKKPTFHNGYYSKLDIRNKGTAEVFSCRALCNLQTFTATCHLPIKKETSVECSTNFFATYEELGETRNAKKKLEHLKKVLSILVFILCVLGIIITLKIIICIFNKFRKKRARKSSVTENKPDDVEKETNKLIDEEAEAEYKPHTRPSILLNGEMLFEGDTPFAKVTYKSNKPIISFVNNTDALQNWDPGVSCFTLASSDSDFSEEYVEKKKDSLVPYNEYYEKNHSASCPEVLHYTLSPN